MPSLPFVNSFARLPPHFYSKVEATPLPQPYLVHANTAVLPWIGLAPDAFAQSSWVESFAGNQHISGSEPLAAVYSGHQFGVWAGQLGDGRAILLGETRLAEQRWEIQLKGAGKTPYSRMGDGRAVLRSSIREYLCAEAMHGLGIPTTRSLVLIGSDSPVIRETIETAAICTRLAPSFIRFGSFEHWAAQNQPQILKQLADYVIDAFMPACRASNQPYLAFLQEVIARTAKLMAQWQAVGFCHGVMNTDNMSILGLTLDYGPFGFMDAFDASYICNHSDHAGRYAYHMQPRVGHWNLHCLAQALSPLLPDEEAVEAALAAYADLYTEQFNQLLHAKLGLTHTAPEDEALIDDLFALLQAQHPDFTLFFRALSTVRRDTDVQSAAPVRDLFIDRAAFDAWADRYRQRLGQERASDQERAQAMNRVNPRFVLRNHLAETAIRKAVDDRDFSEIARLMQVLSRPYDEQPEYDAYAQLPPDWASQLQVSCSS